MPNNWKTYKLSDFLEIKNGKSKPKDVGIIPIYGGNGILGYSNKSNIDKDVLIIGRVGAYCGAVYFENKPVWISDNAIYTFPKYDDNLKYIYYLLKHIDLNQFAGGSSQPLLTQDTLNRIEVKLPNPLEQQSIASILSAIDEKIENNLAINKTLEEMAMAFYKHWFVDFGPFQDDEFVESELGMIPKGWEVKSIEDLLSIKPINGLYKKSEYQGFGNRWLKMSSVYGLDLITNQKMDLISVTDKEIQNFGCLKDDIVFGRTSLVLEGIGKCAIIKCEDDIPIFESNLFRIRLNKDLVYADIIYMFFKSQYGRDEVKKLARQTAAVSITSKDLTNIKIALPNILVQNEVAEKLDFYINKQLENIKENQTLTQLRDTLLPQLISGAVRLKEFQE